MNLSTARSYKRFGWAPSPGIGKIQWADPALWCVTILGCLSVCFAILLYCQNIFFQDEWALFTIFEKYGAKPDFWRPANEHRIVLTRLIYFGLMKMGHLDVRYVMIISQCLLWATMIPLSSAINVFGWKRWALFLIIGFMYASPAHVENQLWGFQIQWYFVFFSVIVSAYFLTRPSFRPSDFIIAHLVMLLAFLGTSIWPVVMLNAGILIGIRILKDISKIKWLLLWAAIFAIEIVLYFYDLNAVGNRGFAFNLKQLDYTMVALGNLIGLRSNVLDHPGRIALIFGYLGMSYVAVLFFFKRYHRQAFVWGLIQFAILAAIVIALGRANLGVVQALRSRYALMTMPLWIGVVLCSQEFRRFDVLLLIFLTINLTLHSIYRFPGYESAFKKREAGRYCYYRVMKSPFDEIVQNISDFRACRKLYPNEMILIRRMKMLQKQGKYFEGCVEQNGHTLCY